MNFFSLFQSIREVLFPVADPQLSVHAQGEQRLVSHLSHMLGELFLGRCGNGGPVKQHSCHLLKSKLVEERRLRLFAQFRISHHLKIPHNSKGVKFSRNCKNYVPLATLYAPCPEWWSETEKLLLGRPLEEV